MVIRPAKKWDAEGIFKIVKACEAQGNVSTTSTMSNYKRAIKVRKRFLVIEDESGVVRGFMLGMFKKEFGFMSTIRMRVSRHTDSDFFYVMQICIDPQSQRKGYGHALNREVFRGLLPDFPVYLSVDSRNLQSLNFHRSMGYSFVDQYAEEKGKKLKILFKNTPMRYFSSAR